MVKICKAKQNEYYNGHLAWWKVSDSPSVSRGLRYFSSLRNNKNRNLWKFSKIEIISEFTVHLYILFGEKFVSKKSALINRMFYLIK